MSVVKSPNNQHVLHNVLMENVLRTIQGYDGEEQSKTRMEALNPLETKLGTLFFFWMQGPPSLKYLFSKKYIDKYGTCQSSHYIDDDIDSKLMKVREYYTDGVRAIGVME